MTDTPAAPAPVDPWSMTPDQATAALAAMHTALYPPPSTVPQDAQDARVTLERLSRDASWAESLFKGIVETRKQFDALIAKAAGANDTEDMVAGIVEPAVPLFETTANGELPRRHVEAAISSLRDSGLNDESISQAVNLPPISRSEFMAAQALQAKLHGTAEWRGKLLSGDYETTTTRLTPAAPSKPSRLNCPNLRVGCEPITFCVYLVGNPEIASTVSKLTPSAAKRARRIARKSSDVRQTPSDSSVILPRPVWGKSVRRRMNPRRKRGN